MAYTTIKKPSDYFNTKLYVGNESTNAITGVGHQPDFVWMKNRDTDYYYGLYDSVRGTGTSKSLYSNAAEAEGQNTGNLNLASFDSDGFTLGATSSTNVINKSSQNHVSWNWKAGTAVSGNTGGSGTAKTYTGSVNTTSGFSIIKYVGNGTAGHTIPHHLGTANIGSIFVKNLDSGSDYWYSYHKPLGATKTLILNETDGVGTNTMWNNTAPTSSVFSVGALSGSNSNNANYIAYIFSDVQGYCKTGSYTGNNSATDGTFFYTGFKPAMIIIKKTDTGQWTIFDNKRNPSNAVRAMLVPNATAVELSQNENNMDFLSNGVKMYNGDGVFNAGGSTYIYMAFAEEPLVGDNPATAR